MESSISEELDSSDVFNDKVLYGNWFTPHEASVMNITFNRDNTFKMKDYKKDERDIIFRTREGTYSVNGETITLRCSNGENQTLECIEIEGRKYLCINNTMMIKGLLN
ncbi:MAG: copper resistance protein NlpE [Bacteroidales bacterium]|nr:copper resistance protein NlpE [Bacteroidales bacterium]